MATIFLYDTQECRQDEEPTNLEHMSQNKEQLFIILILEHLIRCTHIVPLGGLQGILNVKYLFSFVMKC